MQTHDRVDLSSWEKPRRLLICKPRWKTSKCQAFWHHVQFPESDIIQAWVPVDPAVT